MTPLKGIKSIHKTNNYLTDEIEKFLTSEEQWGIPSKSNKPVSTATVSEPQYVKELGGNDQTRHKAWITGCEIVVETTYTDNGSTTDSFKGQFESEDEFVEMYNQFIEWVRKTIK